MTLWCFAVEKNSLWRKIIAAIYGEDTHGWSTLPSGESSRGRPWMDIQHTNSFFANLVYFKVSKGENVKFWEDTWLDDSPLSITFPSFYGLSFKKGMSIADCWVSEAATWDLWSEKKSL